MAVWVSSRKRSTPSFNVKSLSKFSLYGGRPSITGFWAVPVSGGQPKLLIRFDDPSRIRMYPRFGSDGQKFYFSLTEFESDLWLIELSWDSARSE